MFLHLVGPRFCVQIGEKTIDYNEEFRLFLTTRNPAPEIPPDAASVITEVNFTTTKAGLTGQVILANPGNILALILAIYLRLVPHILIQPSSKYRTKFYNT